MKNSKITIDEVAKIAGVSKSTVSHFLNKRFDKMSERTRKNIELIIEELDYRPNRTAQNLKLKNTRVIGCVIADVTNQFSSSLVNGISDRCESQGYQVIFTNTNNNSDLERKGLLSLIDNKLDGLIVNTAGGNDNLLIEIDHSGIPVVLADRSINDYRELDTVTTSNYTSSFECLRHLHEEGFSRVFFFTGDMSKNRTRKLRHEGFIDGVKNFMDVDAEEDYHGTYIVDEYSEEAIIRSLKEIESEYSKSKEKIAIFCVNGSMTWNLIKTMKKNNYKIGVDFGLCGFDDWEWSEIIEPPITSIRQDSYEVGQRAAEILIQRIEKELLSPKVFLQLDNKLIKRLSTTMKK